MGINIENFEKFLETNFKGNITKCARALNIAPSTLCRLLKGNSSAGVKLLSNLMEYCNNNNLNYKDYIFLD